MLNILGTIFYESIFSCFMLYQSILDYRVITWGYVFRSLIWLQLVREVNSMLTARYDKFWNSINFQICYDKNDITIFFYCSRSVLGIHAGQN